MLKIQHLSHHFLHQEQPISVINNLNLQIQDNQFIVFLGPSGCGKSTLIKLLAGLLTPSSGHIIHDGKEITFANQDRGVVFQQFSLFPWLTVEENLMFGPKLKKLPNQEQSILLNHYLEITQLTPWAKFYPSALSGGMQQRVAIARTLINNPKLVLMDEPFGSLDLQIREQMQDLITSIYEQEKKTIIFITHDITEAILLADIIHVLSPRPMTIKESCPITLQRPRNHRLKYTDAFFELEKHLAQALEV